MLLGSSFGAPDWFGVSDLQFLTLLSGDAEAGASFLRVMLSRVVRQPVEMILTQEHSFSHVFFKCNCIFGLLEHISSVELCSIKPLSLFNCLYKAH